MYMFTSIYVCLIRRVSPDRTMRLSPRSLLFLSVWVGVWSVPIDRNNVEQEAKEEETGVSVRPSEVCC